MAIWQQQHPGKCARCNVRLANYSANLPPVCAVCVKAYGTPGWTHNGPLHSYEESDVDAQLSLAFHSEANNWRWSINSSSGFFAEGTIPPNLDEAMAAARSEWDRLKSSGALPLGDQGYGTGLYR